MKIQEKKIMYVCRGLLIAVICMVASLLVCDINAKAETIRIGTVYKIEAGSSLSFRNAPVTGSLLFKLYNGDSGTILGEETVNGTVWYKMEINGTVGWASSDYIQVTTKETSTPSEPSTQDFEAYLTAQGFPESYKPQLRALHAAYPQWIFEAHHVGLTWNEVVAAESSNHRSLVHTNSISSWKSLVGDDYNWSTGVWKGYDTASWVAASEGIVRYHLDPRNFLDSTYVFQFLKQSYDANIDYTVGLKSMVANSFLAGTFVENGTTKSYIDTLIEAGRQSGVSPYTIAATIIQEQGRDGASGLISGTYPGYEGYYNYFNVGAYQSGSLSPTVMGLIYAQGTDASILRPWNTRTKAITGGAINYGKNYVKVGQDTLFLKKFDLVPAGGLYNHQYMTNIQAAANEGKLLAGGYDAAARAAGLVFKIPVYKDMPSSVASKPLDSGKPYQLLQSITVSGGNFDPAFNMYRKSYIVMVSKDTTKVTIGASAKNPNAVISGIGTISLNSEITYANVTVTIPNVNSETYTLIISRGAKGQWIRDSVGWWYQKLDGSYPVSSWEYIDDEWYYFDGRGYMATGWQNIGNVWYYLDEVNGDMKTGWQDIGDNRYYFEEHGGMVTGWYTIDGKKYFFDANGVLGMGWKEANGKKYYLDENGAMAIGWYDIGDDRYYFDQNGYMQTDWLLLNNVWYYLGTDGIMTIGWKDVAGARYYFHESGVMATGWLKLDDTWYYLQSNGAMAKEWLLVGGTWFYFQTDGAMTTGWEAVGGTWYYFHESGAMATGWIYVDGDWYYLRSSGAMATGWLQLGRTWYYLQRSGAMATGWLNDRGTWYYLDASGAMVTNRYVDGYYVNSKGVWVP